MDKLARRTAKQRYFKRRTERMEDRTENMTCHVQLSLCLRKGKEQSASCGCSIINNWNHPGSKLTNDPFSNARRAGFQNVVEIEFNTNPFVACVRCSISYSVGIPARVGVRLYEQPVILICM